MVVPVPRDEPSTSEHSGSNGSPTEVSDHHSSADASEQSNEPSDEPPGDNTSNHSGDESRASSHSSDHSIGRVFRAKAIDFLPLVRYIPVPEVTSHASAHNFPEWEDSDLVDVTLEDQNSRCYLCLEDFLPPKAKSTQKSEPGPVEETEQEPLRQYPCGHVFHRFCGDRWMSENATCFLCKKDLYPSEGVEQGKGWSARFALFPSQDGVLRRMIDVELIHSYQYDWNMGKAVAHLCFSQDGKYFAVRCGRRWIRVVEVQTGSEICMLDHGGFDAFCLGPDGRLLVTGGRRGRLNIWTVTATGHRIKNTLVGHTAKVRGVDISQDGRSLVSLSFDKTLRTWNIVTGSPVQTIQIQDIPALIRMAPDGRSVAAGFDNEVVKLWDTETGRLLRRFKAKDEVKSIEFMPDSTGILVGDDSGKIRLLDTTRGYTRHSYDIRLMALSRDGRLVASSDDGGEVHIWEFETAEVHCVLSLEDHGEDLPNPSSKGDIFGTCGSDGRILIWKLGALNQAVLTSRSPPSTPGSSTILLSELPFDTSTDESGQSSGLSPMLFDSPDSNRPAGRAAATKIADPPVVNTSSRTVFHLQRVLNPFGYIKYFLVPSYSAMQSNNRKTTQINTQLAHNSVRSVAHSRVRLAAFPSMATS
ncbi:hypothetical protein SCP_0605250 [Sparassis crispa]|uniref:RING-type domain-containing protein n=1 Tax=Sparassis crispa TaxID=139825 RepID=A0A401GQP9_9APHY|nr:hypothetical protein SCP_0605250 [Sparassis crispa]GBE84546.1 hypothetical protein SCP_0605250 [Sparassis crispa]